MAKKNRKKVEKKLTIFYKIKKFLQAPVTFFFSALLLDFGGILLIFLFYEDQFSFASSSALQVLATMVESSVTVLSIFFAVVTFLLGRSPSKLRQTFSSVEFFSACFGFSLSILWGLNNMMIIEPDKRVDCTVVFVPAYLLIASLFLLFLFFYSLFRKR